MCLKLGSSKTKPKIATKDIVCYKGLIQLRDELITPYKRVSIEIGKTYKSIISNKDGEIHLGLHSFKTLKELKNWATGSGWRRAWWGKAGGEYIKCIIPKGSTYYIGTFDCWKSYASDALTYVEIID